MAYKFATIDMETTGLNRFKHEITWIGVGLSTDTTADIDKTLLYNMSLQPDVDKFVACVEKLKQLGLKLIWQNGKFDTLFEKHKFGIHLPIHDDVMLLGTAYDMAGEHGLKKMAQKYLGVEDWDIPKKEKLSGDSTYIVPYLTKDVKYTWELYKFFIHRLTDEMWMHYFKILKPAYLMYRDVEERGVYFDSDKFIAVKRKYMKLRKKQLASLNALYDINWNSSDQLQKVLFEYEKLPVIKRSPKTGKPSADASVLKKLAYDGYELPKQILAYREADTLVKMFLNRWGEDASVDGRIHPSFGLTNVRTGRTSCSNPNLQQVPRNPEVRSCFTAPKGKVFFEADYSQLELRIAADYANDRTMLKIYREGGDIHTKTAMIMTNGREPTKDERTKAKPVNFGYLYGMQAKGFVNYAFSNYDQVFTIEEAMHNRQLFFALYSSLEQWHKEMIIKCNADGGVYNRFGRFRALPDIWSHDWAKRSGAERRAINTPVQSTGSDLLISSAAQINRLYKNEGIWICGTIHDSIVGECYEKDRDWVEEKIREVMVHPDVMDIFDVSFKIPLEVDIGWGAWGSK